MKKLIFIRHGKAEEPAQEITDFERSLTPKGKSVSKLMARRLKEIESTPGIIVTSPAFRALETAIVFAREFSVGPEKIIMDNNFYYNMSFKYLTGLLSLIDNNNDSVALFGHNPSFSELSNILCKQGCDYMPKSGVIGISFNIKSWTEIKQHQGKLEYFLKPESLL